VSVGTEGPCELGAATHRASMLGRLSDAQERNGPEQDSQTTMTPLPAKRDRQLDELSSADSLRTRPQSADMCRCSFSTRVTQGTTSAPSSEVPGHKGVHSN
jgi:hypothetical protein